MHRGDLRGVVNFVLLAMVVIGLPLAAIALGCVGMAGALNGLWWLPSVAATVLTVLVVTGAARWLRVPSPLVTVLGLAALLLALTVVHLPSHALLGFIPTGETFTAAGELWRSSGDFISRDAAPYGPNPGLAFVLCTLRKHHTKWFLRLAVLAIPLPWIAVMVGNGQGEKRDPRQKNVYKPAAARAAAHEFELEQQRRRELGAAGNQSGRVIIDHDDKDE